MKITKSNLFLRDVSKNRSVSEEKIEKTLALLEQNSNHPSLQNKNIICKKADNLYSIRVDKKYRILYFLYSDQIELYRMLDHDRYDRLTKNC